MQLSIYPLLGLTEKYCIRNDIYADKLGWCYGSCHQGQSNSNPALVAQAINQEMQQGGEIRKAFDHFNEQVRGGKRMSSGAQFLVQKLRQSQKNQLTGTAQKQHLLEASAENLESNSNGSSKS